MDKNPEQFFEFIQDVFNRSKELTSSDFDQSLNNIILLGPTGGGKSSFSLTLEEKEELETKTSGISPKKNKIADRIIADKNKIIGNSSQSLTYFPKCRKFDQFYVWDTPGFEDTKGCDRKIANTCYLKRLFDIMIGPKIFIVVNYSSCLPANARGKTFKETIHMVCEWMKKIENFEKSLSLVITGADPRKVDVDDIISILKEFLEVSKADQLIKTEEKKVIKSIANNKRIILMPSPPDDRNLSSQQYYNYYEHHNLNGQVTEIANLTAPLPMGKIRAIIDNQIVTQIKIQAQERKKEIQNFSRSFCMSIEQIISTKLNGCTEENFDFAAKIENFIEKLSSLNGNSQPTSALKQLIKLCQQLVQHNQAKARQMAELLDKVLSLISKIDLYKVFDFDDTWELNDSQIFHNYFVKIVDLNINDFKIVKQKIIKKLEAKTNERVCEAYRTYIDRIPETSGFQAWKKAMNFLPAYLNSICLEISSRPLPQFNNWIKEFSTTLSDRENYQFKEIERIFKMIKPMGSRIKLYPQEHIKEHIRNFMKYQEERAIEFTDKILCQLSYEGNEEMLNEGRDILFGKGQLANRVVEMQNQLNQYSSQIHIEKVRNQQAKQQISCLYQSVQILKRQRTDLFKAKGKMEVVKYELEQNGQQKDRRIKELQQNIKQSNQHQIEKLKKKIKYQGNQLKYKDRTINHLQQQTEKLKNKIKYQGDQLKQKDRKVKELKQQVQTGIEKLIMQADISEISMDGSCANIRIPIHLQNILVKWFQLNQSQWPQKLTNIISQLGFAQTQKKQFIKQLAKTEGFSLCCLAFS